MKSFKIIGVAVALLGSLVAATPCPFGQLAEAGKLSSGEAAKFFAARDKQARGEDSLNEVHDHAEAVVERDNIDNEKRQFGILGGLLGLIGGTTLGGGLLGGVLQPLQGVLQGLDVPVPQPFYLKEIPGNDPNHQFQYPEPTDVRGPCPGLNTLANHGYIQRNGITTFAEAANACQTGFGIAYDTCSLVSALGLLSGGDLLTGKYSIGGPDSRVPNTLGPAKSISWHGLLELDNSITREDAYFGNAANFQMSRWNRIIDIASRHGGNFGREMWAEERVIVYNESRSTNPEFNAEIVWLIGSNFVRSFYYKVFPNALDGKATEQVLAPFHLNETFPPNWYRSGTPADTVATAIQEIVYLLTATGNLTLPGQNQGLGNFVPLGIDASKLSTQNVTCFVVSTLLHTFPGQLTPVIFLGVDLIQAFVGSIIAPFFAGLNCPDPITQGSLAQGAGGPSFNTQSPVIINGVYQ